MAHLGVEMIQALALLADVFGRTKLPTPEFDRALAALQEHSLTVGRLSKLLVTDSTRADEALMAGILHDIGKIVLAQAFPDDFAPPRAQAQASLPHDVERDVFGMSHAEVGAYLLSLWGMPLSTVQAVAYHHTPGTACGQSLEIPTAVHVADALVHELGGETASLLDEEYLARVGAATTLTERRKLAGKLGGRVAS